MEIDSYGPAPTSRVPLLLDNSSLQVRRAWHAVAASAELGDEPLQVWLLGEPWVLVRLAGAVRAFPDRCPHRLAPLSAGRVTDGTLQCGYHGWRFGADGRCVEIPALGKSTYPRQNQPSGAQARISKRATLPGPHAVIERYGLVWLAPDEPVAPLPEFPEWGAEGFETAMCTVVRTPAGAAQLVDNFMDASHFPYVHAASFGAEESALVVDAGVERDGWSVSTTFSTWYRTWDDPKAAAGERPEVQRQELFKQGFASYNVYLRLDFPDIDWTFGIMFCCQPESATSTRVYKLLARRDDLPPDPRRLETFVKDEDQITAEDLGILERYPHRHIHLDRRAEMHTKADRLSLAWRTLMADLFSPSPAGLRAAAGSSPDGPGS
jgi:phenylpropionate dioxygenase-like ring-hydroxylating dioxygenase large terminal subunit